MANYTTFSSGAFTDAQKTNETTRSAKIYTDLNLYFQRNSSNQDINKVTDVQSVKRAIRNLVLTNHYERPFHPEIGSNVRAVLFEPVSPIVEDILSRHIRDVIENFEPRVELININSKANVDENAYNVTIEFFVQNSPSGVQTVNLFLERLR